MQATMIESCTGGKATQLISNTPFSCPFLTPRSTRPGSYRECCNSYRACCNCELATDNGFGTNVQGGFHNSVAKWVVLNSQRVVTVLHPYRLGHKKPYATHEAHPAHA